MIKTATQLKAKIRNLSDGDSTKAQTLIRNYIMERFLERISLSPYRKNFILKGGMLVASVVGLEARATMDIDATARALTFSRESIVRVIEEIMAISLPDGVLFSMTGVTDIMGEHDYPGVRFLLEATMDNIRQPIKIDLSTGDVITPEAVEYSYKLMFEERSIPLFTYNLETLIAEKLETIMARGKSNTRMRDFYDIHVIMAQTQLDLPVLRDAFHATSASRNTVALIPEITTIIGSVGEDAVMSRQWENYRKASFFVGELSWETVIASVARLASDVLGTEDS